jgi:hypothetical protein
VINESSFDTKLEGAVSLKADYKMTGSGALNYNGFVFDFTSATGAANLLTNPSFESPDASSNDLSCSDNWACFNSTFTSSNNFQPGGGFVNPTAYDGSQVVKQFGADAGANQTVAASPGDTVTATAYAMNWNGDNFNNIGLLQIFFFDASGVNISGGFTPFAQVAAGSDAIVGGSFDYVLSGTDGGNDFDWTLMEVSAVAPAGTVETRIQIIHILEASTPAVGALFWDNASLSIDAAAPADPADISGYEVLKFGINTASASGLMDLEVKMDDPNLGSASVFLSAYTPSPSIVAGWDLYEIPLSDFIGVDKTQVTSLGYLSASSSVTGSTAVEPTLFDATLYFDDIHFDQATTGGAAGFERFN